MSRCPGPCVDTRTRPLSRSFLGRCFASSAARPCHPSADAFVCLQSRRPGADRQQPWPRGHHPWPHRRQRSREAARGPLCSARAQASFRDEAISWLHAKRGSGTARPGHRERRKSRETDDSSELSSPHYDCFCSLSIIDIMESPHRSIDTLMHWRPPDKPGAACTTAWRCSTRTPAQRAPWEHRLKQCECVTHGAPGTITNGEISSRARRAPPPAPNLPECVASILQYIGPRQLP